MNMERMVGTENWLRRCDMSDPRGVFSIKAGSPVFINCGSSEMLHLGYLPV